MEDHVSDDKKSNKTVYNGGPGAIVAADDLLLIKQNGKNGGGGVVHHVEAVEVEKEEGDLNPASLPLLPPPRKGGLARKADKLRRSVQWNDKNGNKLFEVMEFQPSDVSDSDDEDNDSCMCEIM